MMTFDTTTERFRSLAGKGILSEERLKAAEEAAAARGAELETVLVREFGVPKLALLQALAEHYRRPFVEYDEKMPIAPELLAGLDNEKLTYSRWFPIISDGDTVVIAANDPENPAVLEEARRMVPADRYEVWVALAEDIQWYIQDYLHARPGYLIGTERTGYAFWRNTMALWRTRLACYRTDLALARTNLALLRWGLGFVALGDGLLRAGITTSLWLSAALFAGGIGLGAFGLHGYLRVRRSRLGPPGDATIVEVTAATVAFLERFHDIEGAGRAGAIKGTMLARIGDLLGSHCTILMPQPASRERTHLARERNVLAAQRTIAGAYRTLYARGRTGLAFIRTGVSFVALGIGLVRYFGPSLFTALDAALIIAGLFMAVDGGRWYFPVRRELSEVPRCPVPQGTS
ncbi:MAG: GspE/PulE/PilB domain-containing protein [Nitrospirota bacterium]